MGLEAGNGFITGLVNTNPVGATDPKSQGDDHLRLIKTALLGSFPNIGGAMTLTHAQLNEAARLSAANAFTNSNSITVADNAVGLTVAGATGKIKIHGYHAGFVGTFLQVRNAADSADAPLTINSSAMAFAATLANFSVGGVAGSDFARISQANAFIAAQSITAADNADTLQLKGATSGRYIVTAYDTGTAGTLIRSLNTAGAAFIPLKTQALTFNFVTSNTATNADVTFNGVAVNDFARLSQGNTFVASNTRNSAVGSLFDRWQLSGVDKGYVGVGGGGAIGGLTSSDFGYTSIGGGSAYIGTAGNARLVVDNAGNFDFKAGTVTSNNAAASEVGYKGLPQNSQAVSYTTVLADCSKNLHQTGATKTFTIDDTVAYPVGSVLNFSVDNATGVAITCSTPANLHLAGTGTTGARALAQYGTASAQKTAAGQWLINGAGLT